ncbi:hypothetical protein [Georgenia thermotolerans]|uniref:Uncharacterized protein n=1 Tax=Georgenia thermotolerans TaxID=527326 RepID=A0A7J5UUN9_9MICO|nr:hypothetical protein [Georgenia thermotolerans]KAE8766009.1 hypothetical protein GB883_00950 [Georgenia thermotolerans]
MPSSAVPSAGGPERTGAPSPAAWPLTVVTVMLGACLLVLDGYVALINAAPLFGERPERDALIESGMGLVTAAAPIGALCALAWRAGSRWGLLFLVIPTGLLVAGGMQRLLSPGGPGDPDRDRTVRPGDVVGELTLLNWGVTALAMTVLLLAWLAARRRRHTQASAGTEPPLQA